MRAVTSDSATHTRMHPGFTLIEMIVGVGLLGMMGVLTYSIITSMLAISSDMDDLVDTNHMARVAMERMATDLSQAFLSLNQGIEETRKTQFLGERERLTFCYVGNIPVKKGGMETDQGVVEFRLGAASEDRDGRTLVRRFNPVITDDIESGGTEQILAVGVTKLRFEYWDESNEEWDDDWMADDPLAADEPGFQLPPRVKIHLEMVDKNGVDYIFETQASLHMRRPLLFGKPVSAIAQQWYQLDKQKRVEDAVKAQTGQKL